jgi:hypothetical protein
MGRSHPTWIGARRIVLALILLAGLPVAADASGITFQNDTNLAVVVQGETFVKGMLRRGQPLLIERKKMALDANVPPGSREIRIYDANQPGRLLLRINITHDGNDRAFSIMQLPTPPNAPPKVKLTPVPLP